VHNDELLSLLKIGKSVPINICKSSKFHKKFRLNKFLVWGKSGNTSSGVSLGREETNFT